MTNQTEMRFSFRRVDPAITVRSTTIYVHLESLELWQPFCWAIVVVTCGSIEDNSLYSDDKRLGAYCTPDSNSVARMSHFANLTTLNKQEMNRKYIETIYQLNKLILIMKNIFKMMEKFGPMWLDPKTIAWQSATLPTRPQITLLTAVFISAISIKYLKVCVFCQWPISS